MINLDKNKEKSPQSYFIDFKLFMVIYGLPGWLSGKKSCNAGDTRDSGLIPNSENTLEEGTATQSIILARKIPVR